MKHPSYGALHTYIHTYIQTKWHGFFFSAYAIKIEKQAYQLAEWIVVSQLKTVLNDKFGAYFYLKTFFREILTCLSLVDGCCVMVAA
jgi:hypothetical protein